MKYLLTIIASFLLFSSCSKSSPDEPKEVARRTVLVYMSAENNLTPYANSDILEMVQGSKNIADNCRLLVYVDHADANEKPFIARIAGNEKKQVDTLYTFKTDDYSSNMEVFKEAITRTVALCPAQEYGLVLWGHASGWIIRNDSVAAQRAPRRAYGMDTGTNSAGVIGKWMNMSSMAQAIQQTGIKFKFIFSDCCNMQSIEAAYELRHAVEYLIAAPSEITGWGAPYNKVIPDLFLTDDEQMYKSVCDDYHQQLDYVNGHLPISVIKTDQLEQLAQATGKVLPLISPNLPKDDFGAGHIFYYGLAKSKGWSYTYPQEEKTLYDMNDIIRWGLGNNTDTYTEWHAAFHQAVVYSKMSTFWHANSIESNLSDKKFVDFEVTEESFGGVSMFFPLTKYDNIQDKTYYNYNQDIKKMQWYYAVGWPDVDW